MRTYFLIVFVATMLSGVAGVSAQNGSQNTSGYIIKVDGDKVYLNLPDAKVSDIVSVLDNGGSMEDPKTRRTIRTEPEVVGQIKIIAALGDYSVGRVYGNMTTPPGEGMTVQKGPVVQKNKYGETTVMIAPAEVNFPQGLNTTVGDGFIGDLVSDALMEHLMESDKIQLIDRSMLTTQQSEISLGQSSAIDPNTAIEFGKISGVRYLVKITLQKPDVVNISDDIPVAGLVNAFTNGRNTNITQHLPTNVHTAHVKVSVRIVTHVVDLQTGKVLFMSAGEGSAKGSPQIGIESPELGGNGLKLNNKEVDFTQTVIGKAIDHAFKKIGKELNEYFSKNL